MFDCRDLSVLDIAHRDLCVWLLGFEEGRGLAKEAANCGSLRSATPPWLIREALDEELARLGRFETNRVNLVLGGRLIPSV